MCTRYAMTILQLNCYIFLCMETVRFKSLLVQKVSYYSQENIPFCMSDPVQHICCEFVVGYACLLVYLVKTFILLGIHFRFAKNS